MNEGRLRELQRLPLRSRETWQGGLIRMPGWITGEDRPPYRSYAAMWMAVRAHNVHLEEACRPEERSLSKAVNALVSFACDDRLGGYRPGRVQVNDPALAEHLQGVLADSGIDVELVERLDCVESLLQEMMDPEGERISFPGPLEAPGVTLDRFRRFAEAAAALYRAAPWRHLTDMDMIEIQRPAAPEAMQSVIVLGNAGQTYGLGFAAGTREQIALRRQANRGEPLDLDSPWWQLTFDAITELPFSDADLWEDHGLPVAGERAYPLVLGIAATGEAVRADRETLAFLEGLLWAFSETTEAEIDSGRWTKSVTTFDGPVQFALTLPDLLNPPSVDELLDRGYAPDHRASERAFAQINRYFEQHPAENAEEMTEVLNAKFTGQPLSETISPPSSPLERAQDLCYEAFGCRGRRAVQLARQALTVSPDCADAYVILAEYAASPETELEYYQQGVAAGQRALGPETFEKDKGHFWGVIATRPYMRAVMGAAQTLEKSGRIEEAVDHYRRLLELNPDDNQGARYLLLPRLLELGRDGEAASLLKRYDESSAEWKYGNAILAFRLSGGDAPAARSALAEAFRENSYVVDAILAEEPAPLPSAYSPGGVDEAVVCAETLRPALAASPGAEQWLAAEQQRRQRKRQSRQREKRRKDQRSRRKGKKKR